MDGIGNRGGAISVERDEATDRAFRSGGDRTKIEMDCVERERVTANADCAAGIGTEYGGLCRGGRDYVRIGEAADHFLSRLTEQVGLDGAHRHGLSAGAEGAFEQPTRKLSAATGFGFAQENLGVVAQELRTIGIALGRHSPGLYQGADTTDAFTEHRCEIATRRSGPTGGLSRCAGAVLFGTAHFPPRSQRTARW